MRWDTVVLRAPIFSVCILPILDAHVPITMRRATAVAQPVMAFNPLSLLFLKFRGRTVAVLRDRCVHYQGILAVAQHNFRPLQDVPVQDVVLLAVIPGYPDQAQVELSKEVWSTVSAVVHTVTIALESERTSDKSSSPVLPDYKDSRVGPGTVGPPFASSSPPPPPSLQQSVPNTFSLPAPRKPVIYLYPPSSIPDVTIELRLTSSWHFSAVYPLPQTSIQSYGHQPAQSLTWAIAAEPNGTLIEKTTGTEVSYLYWEAIADSRIITPNASRATTPVGDMDAFDPSHPSVNPDESILLPIGKVPSYLDAALKALSLHTEARNSFITYWLPDLLKHEYVALRFLAQASYEKAAQMHISPVPDVVTRVFMLFCGVSPGDLGRWAPAAARVAAEDGSTFWAQVVGVDSVRASDRGLFRVLEWGGMEVK